jgi:ParB family transcriptional regulator, chromosome partitioning protein
MVNSLQDSSFQQKHFSFTICHFPLNRKTDGKWEMVNEKYFPALFFTKSPRPAVVPRKISFIIMKRTAKSPDGDRMPQQKKAARRKKAPPGSAGLSPQEALGSVGKKAQDAVEGVQKSGGVVLGTYRDPFGGHDLILAALPIERVEPTPYQRDASGNHVKRLMNAIEKIGSFLDPILVIPRAEGFWTPNGNHRLQAMRKLGAKSIAALLIPEVEMAFKILALNTEKAHNLREKSLEVIRMYRALAAESARNESDFAFEFEEPAYLTLGLCYENKPRFSGGAYQPVLRRVEGFLQQPLSKALPERVRRAQLILNLDEAIGEVVAKLKERGLMSPYLRPFVVARVNPIRFSKGTEFDFDDVIGKMAASAKRFNVDKVRQEDLARTGGAPEYDE